MLTVTEAARARLAQILIENNLPEGTAVRLVCEGQRIALQRDSEREGDTTFDHEGRVVLLLDTEVSELLAEDTLDVEGSGLTLRHSEETQ